MQVQEKIIAPKKPRKTAIKDSKKVLGKAMAKTPAKKTAAVKAPAKTKKTKADGALTLLEKIMKCLDDMPSSLPPVARNGKRPLWRIIWKKCSPKMVRNAGLKVCRMLIGCW